MSYLEGTTSVVRSDKMGSMALMVNESKFSEYMVTVTILKTNSSNKRRAYRFKRYAEAVDALEFFVRKGAWKVALEGILKTGGSELLIGR